MKRNSLVGILSAFFVLSVIFVGYVYLTEFYYTSPGYKLAVRNDTGVVLRNTALHLSPKGDFEFGIMDGHHGLAPLNLNGQ